MFLSVEGCDAPSVMGRGDDTRCLSFAFRDMFLTVYNVTEQGKNTTKSSMNILGLESSDDSKDVVRGFNARIYRGWYYQETGNWGLWRWITQNATFSLYNPLNRTVQARLGFDIRSFYQNRRLEVFANGKLVGDYSISTLYNRPGPTIWIYEIPHENEVKSQQDFNQYWINL